MMLAHRRIDLARYESELSSLTDSDLLSLRALADVELRRRGLSLDVGSIGEKLVLELFNSTPGLPKLMAAPRGAKNVDALSRDGDRYSVKTFLKAKKTGTVYPDSENREKQLFEYLLVVKLTDMYTLETVRRYAWRDFVNLRGWDRRMNAWYLPLSKKNLQQGETMFGESIESKQ